MEKWYDKLDLLSEGRLEDVKKKYGVASEIDDLDRHIDYLSENDPSGNNKYLDWMVKQLMNSEVAEYVNRDDSNQLQNLMNKQKYSGVITKNINNIIRVVSVFDHHLPNLKNKDINAYKSVQDVIQAISDTKGRGRKSEEIVKEDTVYEDQNFVIYHPKSRTSSCSYGSGARWCIAANAAGNMFNSYAFRDSNDFYFAVDKNREQDNRLQKIAMQFHSTNKQFPVEIFNKLDHHVAGEWYGPSSGKDSDMPSEEFMKQYFGDSYEKVLQSIQEHYKTNPLEKKRKISSPEHKVDFKSVVLNLIDYDYLDMIDDEYFWGLFSSYITRFTDEQQVLVSKLAFRAMKFIGFSTQDILPAIAERFNRMKPEVTKHIEAPLKDLLVSFKREFLQPQNAHLPYNLIHELDASSKFTKLVITSGILNLKDRVIDGPNPIAVIPYITGTEFKKIEQICGTQLSLIILTQYSPSKRMEEIVSISNIENKNFEDNPSGNRSAKPEKHEISIGGEKISVFLTLAGPSQSKEDEIKIPKIPYFMVNNFLRHDNELLYFTGSGDLTYLFSPGRALIYRDGEIVLSDYEIEKEHLFNFDEKSRKFVYRDGENKMTWGIRVYPQNLKFFSFLRSKNLITKDEITEMFIEQIIRQVNMKKDYGLRGFIGDFVTEEILEEIKNFLETDDEINRKHGSSSKIKDEWLQESLEKRILKRLKK